MTDRNESREYRLIAQSDVEKIYLRLGDIERTQAVAEIQAKHMRDGLEDLKSGFEEMRKKISNGFSERLSRVEGAIGSAVDQLESHIRESKDERKEKDSRLWSIKGPIIVWLVTGILYYLAVRVSVAQSIAAAIEAAAKGAP